MSDRIAKTAMITLCGRPNVGKSSLINALVGEKIAIVSNKAQTTRSRICGVVNRGNTQLILLDTPGLHRPKTALGDYMVRITADSLTGVDCAVLLVEPIPHVGEPEAELMERIQGEHIPGLLCINKMDTVPASALLPVMAAYGEIWKEPILPISAQTGEGLPQLLSLMEGYAQPGPQLFPDGQVSDQPERQVLAELLREKLLSFLDQEIPHGTAVEIVRFSQRENGVVDVEAVIYCERPRHKAIIIGRRGEMLKKISAVARQEMERFLGEKVYLQTWVKVKERWREEPASLKHLGFRRE